MIFVKVKKKLVKFSLFKCMQSLLNAIMMFNQVKYLLSCIQVKILFISDKEL